MNNRCLKTFWDWIWSLVQMTITGGMVICNIYLKSEMLLVSAFLAGIAFILFISLTVNFISTLKENSKHTTEIVEED